MRGRDSAKGIVGGKQAGSCRKSYEAEGPNGKESEQTWVMMTQ
jgi:hypothetical protein